MNLIERIEVAEAGSRELDCAIGVAIERFYTQPNKGWPERLDYCERRTDGMEVFPGNGFDQLVPRYSTSLDAAMSLVPVHATFVDIQICARGTPEQHCAAQLEWETAGDATRVNGYATTPALALCAAALRSIGDTHDD